MKKKGAMIKAFTSVAGAALFLTLGPAALLPCVLLMEAGEAEAIRGP